MRDLDTLKTALCNDIAMLFKKDFDLVTKNTDKFLLCEPFYLTPEELLYLYFYVKRKYDLSVTEEKIIEGAFQTIDKIYNLLN